MAIQCRDCGREGGSFVLVNEQYVCKHCRSNPPYRGDRAFPLTTTHGDGHTTVINSMRDLRRHERQHGIVSHAFNQDQGNRKEW